MEFDKNFKLCELFSSELNNSNYIIYVTSLKEVLYNLKKYYKIYDYLNYYYYTYYDTLINTNLIIIKNKFTYFKKLRKSKHNNLSFYRNELINLISDTIQLFKLKLDLYLKNNLNNYKKRKLH
jgi:hypothetical protein